MGIITSKNRSKVRSGRRISKTFSTPPSLFIQHPSTLITEKYEIIENIGSGAFSEVKLCISKQTQEKRAVKIIHKSYLYLEQFDEKNQLKEINILTSLAHPNILRCYEVFEDHFKFYLVTELCSGGTLFEKIKNFGILSEDQISSIVFQILSALCYCHEDKHIIHRDLKPENILIEDKGTSFNLKLADFGSACYFDPGQKFQQTLGTPYYIAPEVVLGEYSEKCDLWSCGIILYIMLTGCAPYQGKNVKEILQNIKAKPFALDEARLTFSDLAKDLLRKLLEINPENRISAAEALTHPWFSSKELDGFNVGIGTLNSLARFTSTSKLKDAVYTYLATQVISKDELNRLNKEFKLIDKDGDGKISKLELMEQYIKVMDETNAAKVVDSIMYQVDSDQSGEIDYLEFLKACLDYKKNLSKERLKKIFDIFDQDGSGEITVEEVKSLMGREMKMNDEFWVEMIREVDKNGDGKIDLREFIRSLTD